ncbi:CRAL/TRIO domain-containing protein [Plenodomus tracheiphilus IPT5]|uniref:CRAL/TRIO domain-containing protein n=1 Tax=Plenodomus tracheiphilus IPT5 TaxID=1408161 RepID=A0A6A7B7K2_9PLEO|nr:CRAL/TRIO domain-containing protein [Plenodomus tracheiphilus IPT5]
MADLSRIESSQYPAGHLSHLTGAQQQQLEAFKKIAQEQKYWTPANGATQASHDDETMLRYLRARRFVPQEAFKQFKDTEDWRKENKLSDIFNNIEIDEFEQTRRLYPQWLGRRDKRGIPLFLFEVAPLNSKNISAYEKDLAKSKTTIPNVATKNVRLFALYESLTRFVTPLCSMVPRSHPETPISQSNNIVDISGVGLKQFWNLKGHMQDASVLATAHYPETLDRIFIVGAPSFFPTVWGWVKRWFDPITVSKIFILSPANVYQTLSQYIEHENIPKKYGGGLDFEWGSMPNLEPSIEKQMRWENPSTQNGRKTFPIGPIKWEEGPNGEMQAWGVGSQNGKPRRQLVFAIPKPVGFGRDNLPAPQTPAIQKDDPLALTTVGTATHPPDDPTLNIDTPPSDTSSPRGSTHMSEPTTANGSTTLPIREGTSELRFEQQNNTHAAGQLAQGTPDAAVNDHGHGDKTVTMEPNTVGQAPKEKPLPEPEQPPAPGYLEQARQAAVSASATVSSTVTSAAGAVVGAVSGPGDKELEQPVKEKSPEELKLDQAIDASKDQDVEAYLRAKSSTSA